MFCSLRLTRALGSLIGIKLKISRPFLFKGFNIPGLRARRDESEHGVRSGYVQELRRSSQVCPHFERK